MTPITDALVHINSLPARIIAVTQDGDIITSVTIRMILSRQEITMSLADFQQNATS
jgi:hypothetical protein